ncbi:MAG TPA: hypothetical protein VH590_05550 [Ktedonobacterales bacterium]
MLTALATDPRERFVTVRAFANAFAQAAQSAARPSFVANTPAPAPFPQDSTPLPETIRVTHQAHQDRAADALAPT